MNTEASRVSASPLVSTRMQLTFGLSIVLMAAHKVECWITEEWLESPFFQLLIRTGPLIGPSEQDVLGEAIFLTFILWLFAGLGMGWLVLRGGRGPLVALAIWGLTFVLEWHHVVRTIVSEAYYSGVYTAVAYLAFMAFYWVQLLREFRERW